MVDVFCSVVNPESAILKSSPVGEKWVCLNSSCCKEGQKIIFRKNESEERKKCPGCHQVLTRMGGSA